MIVKRYDADAIAQAACAGSFPGGFVAAVRRDCSLNRPTCSTICQNAISWNEGDLWTTRLGEVFNISLLIFLYLKQHKYGGTTCQIIMSTCQIIIFSYQLIMSTCQKKSWLVALYILFYCVLFSQTTIFLTI